MSIFANLFKKQADADAKVVGNVEDFVSLTRVYFQSVIAVNLGITNIRFLPDVANLSRKTAAHKMMYRHIFSCTRDSQVT